MTCVSLVTPCKSRFLFSPPNAAWFSALESVLADCQRGSIISTYSHENELVGDEWRFNCYGFIAHLLLKYAPKAYDSLVQFMFLNKVQPISFDKIPCPFHYAALFSSLTDTPYWSRVPDIEHLQSGDFIVYLPKNYTPQEITKISKERTGMHIMVVENVVSLKPNRINLTIIDCTQLSHCLEDSRVKGGIGRSPLTIQIQKEGASLQWGSQLEVWEKELFFGRLQC